MNELFGEVISEYTLEQAIEDGFHVDFGFMRTSYGLIRIVATTNFLKNTTSLQALSILHACKCMKFPEVDIERSYTGL